MLLSLYLTLVVPLAVPSETSAPNSAALVLVRRNGLNSDDGRKIMQTVLSNLEVAGANAVFSLDKTNEVLKSKGVSDLLACGGRVACLTAAFEGTSLQRLVLVSVSQVGEERAWILEVIEVKTAVSVSKEEWIDSAGALEKACKRLAPLLTSAISPLPVKPKVVDVPPVVEIKKPLDPVVNPVGTKPVEIIAPPMTQVTENKVLPKVLLATAGAMALASIGFGIASGLKFGDANATLPEQQCPVSGQLCSPHTREEADDLMRGYRNSGIASAVFGVLGAGLGAGALLTW